MLTDPAQSTLFAVFADTTLNVLTKDPTAGWTQHQVHQENATMQEVESYRTKITIMDANGVCVAGAQTTISTDRLVGLWQASGNTIIEPGTPVTMTTYFIRLSRPSPMSTMRWTGPTPRVAPWRR